MRCVKGQVHEEGLVIILDLVKERKGIIGHHLSPVGPPSPKPLLSFVPRQPLALIELGLKGTFVACWSLVRHTTTYILHDVKTRVTVYVPFTCHVRGIAGAIHNLRPVRVLFDTLLGPVNKTARVKHGPAGNTYCSTPSSHIIGMGKRHPTFHQTVKIRRFYIQLSVRTDRFIGLIIGKDEHHVGFFRSTYRG